MSLLLKTSGYLQNASDCLQKVDQSLTLFLHGRINHKKQEVAPLMALSNVENMATHVEIPYLYHQSEGHHKYDRNRIHYSEERTEELAIITLQQLHTDPGCRVREFQLSYVSEGEESERQSIVNWKNVPSLSAQTSLHKCK